MEGLYTTAACNGEELMGLNLQNHLVSPLVWMPDNRTEECLLRSIMPKTFSGAVTPLLAWSLIVFFGTTFKNGILDVLSIKKSVQELTASRNSPLVILDIFRVCAIIWVMINHTGSEGRIDVLDRLPSAKAFKVTDNNSTIVSQPFSNIFNQENENSKLLPDKCIRITKLVSFLRILFTTEESILKNKLAKKYRYKNVFFFFAEEFLILLHKTEKKVFFCSSLHSNFFH